MPRYAIIWDLETVPDFDAIRSVNDFEGTDEEADTKFVNGKFPKHVFHKIVCIGAIVAERDEETGWKILRRGAPHCGERSEAELIRSFTIQWPQFRPPGAEVPRDDTQNIGGWSHEGAVLQAIRKCRLGPDG